MELSSNDTNMCESGKPIFLTQNAVVIVTVDFFIGKIVN